MVGLFLVAVGVVTVSPLFTRRSQEPHVRYESDRFDTVFIVPMHARSLVVVAPTSDRFFRPSTTLAALIQVAYEVPAHAIVGAPEWATVDLWRVDARVGHAIAARQLPELVRHLIEDKFEVVARAEVRPMTVSALVLADVRGQLGPGLRRSSPACEIRLQRAAAARSAAAAPDPECREMSFARTPYTIAVRMRGASVAGIARYLESVHGRAIIDATGLEGWYDLDLQFRHDGNVNGDTGESLPEAVSRQLGLRLMPRQGTARMVFVESARRPDD